MDEARTRPIEARKRALVQSAKFAIRDVFDAIVELVTNADDRYQLLANDNRLVGDGRVEIEVERRRGAAKSLLRVRDFADGMDSATMETKLSIIGGRESGLERGEAVRGTHSRGAKDVAALGHVTFESFAGDGRYHWCEITPFLDFTVPVSKDVTPALREVVGIPKGTGTLVTIELDKTQSIPQHNHLRQQLDSLVSLRGILRDQSRYVILRDLGQGYEDRLAPPNVEGSERLARTIEIPGYSAASAKLIIFRAKERFERSPERFRLGGILIESKRAIHEATLFESGLESDPHAAWFYGRLVCPYIDDLCNDFDDRFDAKQPPESQNPTYVLDPSRRSGLVRDHPFVKALFGEALKRLRPLVEEERQREEHERSLVESAGTRKRLNALQKAAVEFMRNFQEEEDETARETEGKRAGSRFMQRGYSLTPPFTQMLTGSTRMFWLTVRQEAFPELGVGSTVQIEDLSPEIISSKRFCGLEPLDVSPGLLRAVWKAKAMTPTPATGIRVRVGPITDESYIEILATEADLYAHITALSFSKKRYTMRTDQKHKRILLLAPLKAVPTPVPIDAQVDSPHFKVTGELVLRPSERFGVAMCELGLKSDGKESAGTLTAKLRGATATCTVSSHAPLGSDLSIKLEDIDLGNQRYRWRQNVLEIAARHPSLRRYLGNKEDNFPGQESKHFRVLIAEVVADAVCALLVRRSAQASPEDYEDADWDLYYAVYSRYMTQFLPTAHKVVYGEV